jgi:hypothetical protein
VVPATSVRTAGQFIQPMLVSVDFDHREAVGGEDYRGGVTKCTVRNRDGSAHDVSRPWRSGCLLDELG